MLSGTSLPSPGVEWGFAASAALLTCLFFCSPGVYPGWEECGGQDLRHAAVAGNEECLGTLPWRTCGARLGSSDLGRGCCPPTSSFAF